MASRNMDYAAAASDVMGRAGDAASRAALIKGQLRGQQMLAPVDTMAAFLQTRDANRTRAQEQQARGLQISNATLENQKLMRDFNDEQKIRDLFGETPTLENGQPDYEAIGGKVSQISPERGAQYFTLGSAQHRSAAELAKNNLDAIGTTLRDANAGNWQQKLDALHKAGIPTDGMPETFDPKFVEGVNSRMLTANEWLDRTAPKAQAPVREPVQRSIDGGDAEDVVFGTNGNWYRPGDMQTPIAANRITVPKRAATTREPVTRLVDGKRADVVFGENGNWYRPGDMKTPIDPSRVASLPENASGGISAAQRGAAERWMQGQLTALEKQLQTYQKGVNEGTMDQSDLDAFVTSMPDAKLRTLNSYRTQIGLDTLDALPPEWDGTAKHPAAAAPAPVVTPPAPAPAVVPARVGGPPPPTTVQPAPPKPTAASFQKQTLQGGKVRVIGPDGTPVVFPDAKSAQSAIDAFLAQ